jgi:hypothetical protein
MKMRGGTLFRAWVQEMADFYEANKDHKTFIREFANLGRALDAYREMLKTLDEYFRSNVSLIPLYSRRILTATAQLYCGRLILDQGVLAARKAQEVGENHFDYHFYIGKVAAARYYARNVVPNVWTVAEMVTDGDNSALDVPIDVLEY